MDGLGFGVLFLFLFVYVSFRVSFLMYYPLGATWMVWAVKDMLGCVFLCSCLFTCRVVYVFLCIILFVLHGWSGLGCFVFCVLVCLRVVSCMFSYVLSSLCYMDGLG